MEDCGLEMNQVEPQVVGARIPSAEGLRMRSPPLSRDPHVEDEDDEDYSDWVQQEPPNQQERFWCLMVALVSVVDIIISAIIVIVAFRFAYRANGISLYCMGIQALSHWISSVLLAFRFKGERRLPDSSAQGLIRKTRRFLLVREQILSECMGIVMLISATGLLFKAFRKIKFWDQWYLEHEDMDKEAQWATEFLAWYGFSMYLLQAGFRFKAARKLSRSIIWHAFVASVVSLLFLFVLGLGASYQKEWSWKAEPIAAIVLSFVTLFEGVRIIIMHLDDMDTRLKYDPRA